MTYHPSAPPLKTVVSFPRQKAWVNATVSATEAERVQGLHGHAFLGANTGMLFWFPPTQSAPIAMTMAKMMIPLDIIFIGNSGKLLIITYIANRIPPGRQRPVLGPAVPWVLEVPAGFVRRHKLTRGDHVIIEADG